MSYSPRFDDVVAGALVMAIEMVKGRNASGSAVSGLKQAARNWAGGAVLANNLKSSLPADCQADAEGVAVALIAIAEMYVMGNRPGIDSSLFVGGRSVLLNKISHCLANSSMSGIASIKTWWDGKTSWW